MPTTSATAGAIVAIMVPFLAACGTDDDADRTVTEPGPDPEPASELVITMDPGDGDAEEWTLTCDPTGGTHPDPQAACDALDGLDPEVMAPVPDDAVCTMIHGGPHTATITGQWDGDALDASFSRENGCEIARWDVVVDLVNDPGDGALP
jgi:hypothetical protein